MISEHDFSILAVDDNPVNLLMIEKVLAKEGYRIITAPDGPTGRQMAVEENPDLILLDIKMPGEDGFHVIRFLRDNSKTTSIPVIFLTAVSEMDAKLAGFELGAVDYITKPFNPQEMLARVRLHLKLSIATNSMIAAQAQKLKQLNEAQKAMLTQPDELPDARFGAYYVALQEAGGDFYDVLSISDDIYAYFVADFSGHDISTGFLTSSIKALLKQNCTTIYKPRESIKMINDVLVEILPAGKYLTACYARLNRRKNELTIISSAHPPVCLVPKDGEPRLFELKGDVLGIFSDVYFEEATVKVKPGDRFYLYSDGVIESAKEQSVWTEASVKMLGACHKVRDLPIQDAPAKIRELLLDQEEEPEDDVVILGVEV